MRNTDVTAMNPNRVLIACLGAGLLLAGAAIPCLAAAGEGKTQPATAPMAALASAEAAAESVSTNLVAEPISTDPASESVSTADSGPLVRSPRPEFLYPRRLRPRLELRLDGPRELPDVNHLLWQPRRQPANRFQRTLLAADKAGYSALAVGYLGTLVGLWEDETALYMMGAGAALGAVLGNLSDGKGVDIMVSPR